LQWNCNGMAMVLQRYLQLETIYSFQESFEGKHLCNNNFHFTEKWIPFCQETIIVSICLQRLCNNLIWRSSPTHHENHLHHNGEGH
jgi:hypothetical protein